ncbi:hypothetical protein [Mobiluncus mulieris]|uniref:hypothetical protein n=1 Tax=Mobiluncus mulieris TaxID=2052 RepID=UPI0020164B1F|nr:hypothetical protein [Mobiluncus mulieris]
MKRTVEFSVREHPRQAPHEPGKNPTTPTNPANAPTIPTNTARMETTTCPTPGTAASTGFTTP